MKATLKIPEGFTESDLKPYAAFILTKTISAFSKLSEHDINILNEYLPIFLKTHIDKQHARDLHIFLSRKGVKDHKPYVSEQVDRVVSSLTQITYKELLRIKKDLQNV